MFDIKSFYEAKDEADLLLLDFMFILDFLCIHPSTLPRNLYKSLCNCRI